MAVSELTPTQILSALKGAGLDVYETPGWRDRCRCHSGSHERHENPTGRRFGPLYGFTVHHTAGPSLAGDRALAYTDNILVAGNGATVGPLCLAGVDSRGRIILVGAGRANHIGGVSARSIEAMRTGAFSMSGYQDLRGSGNDGNTYTLGFEILARGKPNGVQIDATVRAIAALCRASGIGAGSVHGHGECSDQRDFFDPGLDMGAFRRAVRDLINRPREDDLDMTREQLLASKIGYDGGKKTARIDTALARGASAYDQISGLRTANEELRAEIVRLGKLVEALQK